MRSIQSIYVAVALASGMSCGVHAQQTSLVPTEAVGAWTMDYAEHSCDLKRDFGSGPNAVRITLSQSLAPMQVDLRFDGAGVSDLARVDRAVIEDAGSGIETMQLRQYPGMEAPLVVGAFRSLTGASIPSGAPVLTVYRGDRPRRAFVLSDLRAALAALRSCQDDLYRGLSVDSAAMRRIAVDAEPVGDESRWITPDDLPPAYQNMTQTRLAVMRLEIGLSGRVENCTILRSTGAAPLDVQSCRVMTARARYTPARDEAGQAVPTIRTKQIEWWQRVR
jgi:hypothetical protein